MFVFALFILSGVAIVGLTYAKRFEMRNKKPVFIFIAISKGDERMRKISHEVIHFYAEGKHQLAFYLKKQLPLKAKTYVNKAVAYVKAHGEKRFGNIRGSRSIRQHENISEFFKNIKEVEKGNGELPEEVYTEPVLPHSVTEVTEVVEIAAAPSITPKPVTKRLPRRKKLHVVEVE